MLLFGHGDSRPRFYMRLDGLYFAWITLIPHDIGGGVGKGRGQTGGQHRNPMSLDFVLDES